MIFGHQDSQKIPEKACQPGVETGGVLCMVCYLVIIIT